MLCCRKLISESAQCSSIVMGSPQEVGWLRLMSQPQTESSLARTRSDMLLVDQSVTAALLRVSRDNVLAKPYALACGGRVELERV